MIQLIVMRGLPASGKTFWAEAWVAERPLERARVNRDALRRQLFNRDAPLPGELEHAVTQAEQAMVRALLDAGRSVVVDDTNLRARYVRDWADIAIERGAELQIHDLLWVDVEECVSRDHLRREAGERSVGEDVIRLLAGRVQPHVELEGSVSHYTYVPDSRLEPAWIFDVDGTLALHAGIRGPYDTQLASADELNPPVIAVCRALRDCGYAIIIVSGRDEEFRALTDDWLHRHDVPYTEMHMRPAGDRRRDATVKRQLFMERIAPYWCVRGVFDDRSRVVAMWRSIGLTCMQVAPGNF